MQPKCLLLCLRCKYTIKCRQLSGSLLLKSHCLNVDLQKQVDFISNRLIGERWTQYRSLRLSFYSRNATIGDVKDFKNLTNVQDFIKAHGQVKQSLDICY